MKEILQGTDGIRGYVEKKNKKQNKNPILNFEQRGSLTPEFFELYGYVFCRYLQKNNLAKAGDYIIVGKDSRDASLILTQSLLEGVMKAGMKLRFLDVVPTPAVAFYLVKRNRSGGIMITASHNPADQNGIKLFLPPFGKKLLPAQEKDLTKMLYETPYPIQTKQKIAPYKNLNKKVIKKYTSHILKNTRIRKFPKTILMVDCANGALTKTLEYFFRRVKFHKLVLLNKEGKINNNCGVTQLENLREISQKDLAKNKNLSENVLLSAMFREAEKNSLVAEGKLFLSAFVFDGDGDRLIRLEYDCFEKKILILTGDTLAFEFLTALSHKKKQVSFFHTIESDLEMKIQAKKNRWRQEILAVGDKWLLDKALEHKKNFSLGYEASGHFVFPTHIKIRSGRIGSRKYILSKKEVFFTGDGLLAAMKSLEAIYQNHGKNVGKKFFDSLRTHYNPGICKNVAIHGVDKSRLLDKKFAKTLSDFMEKTTKKLLGSDFQLVAKEVKNCPDLHYWYFQNQEGPQAAIFVRNSGTEDKTSLYLRTRQQFEKKFSQVLEKLRLFLVPYLQTKRK
jgi:phosphomannomutase